MADVHPAPATRRKSSAGPEVSLLDEFLHHTPDLIGRAAPDGTVLALNEAAARFFGVDEGALDGINIRRFLTPESHAHVLEVAIPAALRDGHWVGETTVVDRHGRRRTTSQVLVAHLGPDGALRELSTIMHDVTDRVDAEHKLAVSNAFLEAVLDASPDHTAILDHDGRIVRTNAAWDRFASENGWPEGTSFVGLDYLATCRRAQGVEASVGQVCAEAIRATLDGHRDSFTLEYPCHAPSQKRWFRSTVTPFKAPGGRFVLASHTNITQQRIREVEKARLARIPEEDEDPFMRVDRNGRILYLNPVQRRLLARSDAPFKGTRLPPKWVQWLQKLHARGEPDEVLRRFGEHWYMVRAVPVVPADPSEPPYVNIYSTDVTQLKRTQAALEEARAAQNTLLNTVVHDLGGPLTPINLQLSLLEVQSDPGLQRPVALLRRNVTQLSTLIADLKDVANLESGHLSVRPAPTDLGQLVHDAVESLQGAAEQHGVHLIGPAARSVPMDMDDGRILQLVYNLVGNGIRFTPLGGSVRVELVDHGDTVALLVQDTGRGLEPAEIERLFRPFVQVHARHEARERGTGLGLYICKGIAEGHGGTIHVESAGHGHGSTFVVTFAKPGTAADAPSDPAPDPSETAPEA